MDYLNDLLQNTAVQYPLLMVFFLVLGVFRSVFKPLMSVVDAYVKATPSKADDEAFDNFQKSKFYSGLVWVVDYLASVKLPAQKPPAAPEVILPEGLPNGNAKPS